MENLSTPADPRTSREVDADSIEPEPVTLGTDADATAARSATIDATLEVVPAAGSAVRSMTEGPGALIGPYRLVRLLGQGGMGSVFLAEQERPVRRQVALKIIKPGMDSEQVIARFEAERQALALMDHPNIARVLDAGATPSGRPFFVMELVEGVPITIYCDDRRLPLHDRLELFASACQAIQHAHQKGIIHRDVKPSNVLVCEVDGRPVAKVIDFGVAKAIDQRLTEKTLFTQLGVVVGTPEYMSPEQADFDRNDVDTRTDIYSLGVLLYELLTGTTPLRRETLTAAGFGEILRRVRDEEPPTPSSRLGTTQLDRASIAAVRGVEPSRLVRLVRGELDWIVMKALEKDRTRRYETADAFARDVRRFLADEPVEASPPSRSYKVRKFIRRHRAGVAAASAFAAVLLGTTAFSAWQAYRATLAERRARLEAENAGRMYDFLTNGLLNAATPEINPVEDRVTLVEAVDRAADGIGSSFAGRPELEVRMRSVLGGVYRALGSHAKSERQYRQAFDRSRTVLGEGDPITWKAAADLGYELKELGRLAEARKLLEQGRARLTALLGERHADSIGADLYLAQIELRLGLWTESEGRLLRLREVARSALGSGHAHVLQAENTLAVLYRLRGRYRESEALARAIVEKRRRSLGPEHPVTLVAQSNLVLVLIEMGSLAEAEALGRPTLEAKSRVLGPDHALTLVARSHAGQVLQARGRLKEAEAWFRDLVERDDAVFGPDHVNTLTTRSNLAYVLAGLGKVEEANRLIDGAAEAAGRALGPEHPTTLNIRVIRSKLALRGKRGGDTPLRVAELDVEAVGRVLGPGHPLHLGLMNRLGLGYLARGRFSEAERMFRETKALVDAPHLAGRGGRGASMHNRGLALVGLGRIDEAAEEFREASRLNRAEYGPEHPETLQSLYSLIELEQGRGHWEAAAPLVAEMLPIQRRFSPPSNPYVYINLSRLARNHLELERFEAAAPLAREFRELMSKRPAADRERLYSEALLGAVLTGLGRLEEAEPLLHDATGGAADTTGPWPPWTLYGPATGREWLARLYDARGRPDEAATARSGANVLPRELFAP